MSTSALRSCDQRIIIRGLDAEPLEHAVAECPGRAIDAVGNQDVVAGPHHREQRRRDRGEARRQERDARAGRPFDAGERLFEGLRSRGAAAAVLVAGTVGGEIGGVGIEHGRGVIDWRIDEAAGGCGVASAGHQTRVGGQFGLVWVVAWSLAHVERIYCVAGRGRQALDLSGATF
jgi:hypothetical protein